MNCSRNYGGYGTILSSFDEQFEDCRIGCELFLAAASPPNRLNALEKTIGRLREQASFSRRTRLRLFDKKSGRARQNSGALFCASVGVAGIFGCLTPRLR